MKTYLSLLLVLMLTAAVGCKSNDTQAVAEEPETAETTTNNEVPAPEVGSTDALDAAAQKALTPDKVMERLMAGNKRFVEGNMLDRDLKAQVQATSGGQYPSAIVLGCVDSRVPPETVFDQGIGDIFSARVAGNIIDDHALGSIEFATAAAGSKLVVVMGHTACGAVKGACDGVELGHISSLVETIQPSVKAVNAEGETCTSKKSAVVNKVAEHNVQRTIEDMRARSKVLTDLEKSGEIKIVGAMYDVNSGEVTFR